MLSSALSTQNLLSPSLSLDTRSTDSFLQLPRNLDVTVVFGEGPIKSLFFLNELSEEQKHGWEEYKKDPLHAPEPDMYVLEEPLFIPPFEESVPITHEMIHTTNQAEILQWHHLSEICLKRMGKQNALAAGIALVTGMTKTVVITGGHTLSLEQRKRFIKDYMTSHTAYNELSDREKDREFEHYLKYFIRWPSEAELMADVIIRHFSRIYQEKFHRPIQDVIYLETDAKNTLENITLSLNKFPELFSHNNRVGFLSAGHHLERCAIIAHRFNIFEETNARLSAQKILFGQASDEETESHICLLEELEKHEKNPELKSLLAQEQRFIKGLKDPSLITYWLGYTFELADPKRILDVLHQFNDPVWKDAMKQAFAEVGLDFSTFTVLDLEKLQVIDSKSYQRLIETLQLLMTPDYRQMPPPVN